MLRLESVEKQYGDRKVLNNISLTIHGGLVCIVGDSGSGKSTLLSIIGGLESQTHGEVFFEINNKEYFTNTSEKYIKNFIGFVFQDSNLINGLTVTENLQLVGEISNVLNYNTKIENIIKEIGLEKVKNQKVELISGGERLRVAVARALVKDAPILLADEPTGSLDSEKSVQIFEILKKISKNKIVIVVTHNIELAKEYGDRLISIKDGEIADDYVIDSSGCEISNKKIVDNQKKENKAHKLLVKNNIIRSKKRFFSFGAVIAVAIMVLGVILQLASGMSEDIDAINSVYYDADEVSFYPYSAGEKSISSIVMGESYGYICEEELADINNSNIFEEVVTAYDTSFTHADIDDSLNIKYINTDDFFYNRLMSSNIEGSFLKKDTDIILGIDVAEKIGECGEIGNKIILKTIEGNSITFDIVGINYEKNVDGIIYSYISSDIFKNQIYENLCSYIYDGSTVENQNSSYYTSASSGILNKYENQSIIYGRSPQTEGEIVLSYDVFCETYYSLEGNDLRVSENELKQNTNIEEIEDLFDRIFYISANDAYKSQIVGIVSSKDSAHSILVNADWAKNILCIKSNVVNCYFSNLSDAEIFRTTDIARKYSYVSNYEERFDGAVTKTNTWKLMIIGLTIVMVAMFVIIIHSYCKITIDSRKYEIGILISLGVDNRFIQRLLKYEIFILSSISGITGGIILFVTSVAISMFTGRDFSIRYTGEIMLLIILSELIICMTSSLVEVKRIAGIKAIDALHMRD